MTVYENQKDQTEKFQLSCRTVGKPKGPYAYSAKIQSISFFRGWVTEDANMFSSLIKMAKIRKKKSIKLNVYLIYYPLKLSQSPY